MQPATVLVAEELASAREAMVRPLREAGHRVVPAELFSQALEALGAGVIDLVLLGPGGPRADPQAMLERLGRIRAAVAPGPLVPVLAVGAWEGARARAQILDRGADGVLDAAFEPVELVARVGALLRARRQQVELATTVRELEAASLLDPLTRLYNHRLLARRLPEEFARARRYDDPLSLVLVELDGARAPADPRPGPGISAPTASDPLLRQLADALVRIVRSVDLVARYGSEEFVLVLPSTHFAGALPVAQRIQQAARALSVTVSIGAAFYPGRKVASAEDLLQQASAALARARQEGPGWICLHQHQIYLYRPEPGADPPAAEPRPERGRDPGRE